MRLVGEVVRGQVLPLMQRAVEVVDWGGSTSLVNATLPAMLGPSQVLVKVKAASVNPLDVMMSHSYGTTVLDSLGRLESASRGLPLAPILPTVMGRDFSGVVVQGGPLMRRGLAPGSPVWGATFPGTQGCHQEYMVVEEKMLAPLPSGLNNLKAASIPYAGLTAWSAISTSSGLQEGFSKGARVLLLGAGGGVGDIALQLLSRHFGAAVTAVVSGEAGAERALRCGASQVLDYKEPDYQHQLLQLDRFDIVLDSAGVGTSLDSVKPLLSLLRHRGCIVSLSSPLLQNTDSQGLLPGFASSLASLAILNASSLKQRSRSTVRWAYFMPNPRALTTMAWLVKMGRLMPPPITAFPLEKAEEAYAKVEAGGLRGKVVIDMEA